MWSRSMWYRSIGVGPYSVGSIDAGSISIDVYGVDSIAVGPRRLQADLGDLARLVPDHCSKAKYSNQVSHEVFGFPVYIKVTFT